MNKDQILDFINNCTDLEIIDEIKKASTSKGKALREAKKETAKEEKEAMAAAGEALKPLVKVGTIVRFVYGSGKDKTVLTSKVVKLGDGGKTFHVQLEGKEKTTWRYFAQIVEVLEDAEVAE